eukprot:COSAG02_NODE_366_length_23740_cov_20.235904_13_plen_73_part_00
MNSTRAKCTVQTEYYGTILVRSTVGTMINVVGIVYELSDNDTVQLYRGTMNSRKDVVHVPGTVLLLLLLPRY